MIKPPPRNWEYILIELLIDERVVDSRIASQGTYTHFVMFLINEGQTQTLPWAVIISQSKHRKPKPQLDNTWQKRDRSGRFIKTKPILYEEDERP